MLKIGFNGQPREVNDSWTIADLLKDCKIETRFCAVELNLEIVPKDQYVHQQLRDGDQVEVVTLVGGG